MEDDDLNEKQTFLRENILEQGYDAEEFMKLLCMINIKIKMNNNLIKNLNNSELP